MHRARTGYRQQQDERLARLEAERPQLESQIAELKSQLQQALAANSQWQQAYEELKTRALAAYNKQQDEITALKRRLEEMEN